MNNGGCQQQCEELLPGFKCSCFPGFVMSTDGITCIGMSELFLKCIIKYMWSSCVYYSSYDRFVVFKDFWC